MIYNCFAELLSCSTRNDDQQTIANFSKRNYFNINGGPSALPTFRTTINRQNRFNKFLLIEGEGAEMQIDLHH